MRKVYAFLVLLFVSNVGWGQTLYDSFTDGDFTASPVWGGTTSTWQIVANSDVAAGATGSNTLRLNATAVVATEYLSSQIATWGTTQEWGFFLGRRAQAFTAANQAYFWLYANEANLTSATVDGYRIAIGDDAGGDDIRLEYIVNGAVNTTVITSSASLNNGLTDIGVLIRVTRTAVGGWQIFTSTLPTANGTGAIATDIPNSTNANVSQGTGTNNSLVPAANGYVGVAALHSTGANAIISTEFDQIYFTQSAGGTPDIALSSPTPTPAGNISQGSTNNVIYQFELAVTTADATLTGVTVTTAGTYVAADLVNLKCWYSADATFNSASDVLLSTKSTGLGAGGQVFPSFTSQNITNGNTGYMFITADVACAATVNNTLSVNAITTADIAFSSGNKTGSASAGGLQTIIAATLNNVTGAGATNGNMQSSVSWTNPAGCYDDVLIVAATATNTWVPTGTTYATSLVFGGGAPLGNGFAVYQGTVSPQVVTGLTNGVTYYFKIFTRLGSTWSSGVEVTATPTAPVITTYTWIGNNGSWTTATNWSPTRSTPDVTDILQFNDGGTWTVTAVPTQTIGNLLVTGNTNVSLQAGAASNILTIAGGAASDLSVTSGSALNINGANTLTITLLTGATGVIAGNMTFSTAAHKLDAADASGVSFISPAIFTQGTGCTGNVFTNLGTASAIVFGTGTTFVQDAGSNPFALGAPASKVVFQSGSLFRMQQNAALSVSGRTYANLEINFATFSQNQTGATVMIVDNLTITDGTLNLNLTGGVDVRGNISVAAGETLTFTPASAATITFNGTTAQSVSNLGTLSFGTNASITINNSTGVTLSTPVTVGSAGTLTLTAGTLTIGNNNLVATTVSGGSTTSYVRTNGTGTFTINNIAVAAKSFPVGNSTYNPLTIANGSGHNWTVRVTDAVVGVIAPFTTNGAVQRTWTITPSTNPPAGGADLTFQWDGTDLSQVGPSYVDGSNVQLWHYQSAWLAASAAMAPGGIPTARTLTRTGWSQYSDFAISTENHPLPVLFASFSGYRDGSRNQLRWTTANEINNRGFEILRSTDGSNYHPIGFVNSLALNGNSSDAISYAFADNAPAGEKQYYKLRQVDLAGAARLSEVVLIRGGKPNSVSVEGLFPNPAKDQVNVIVAAPKKETLTLLVTDMAGRNLLQKIVNVETGSNTVPLDISNLKSGSYLVRVICSEGCEGAARFVK